MSLETLIAQLVARGWSVFLEQIPGEGCMIGVTRERGLGIEGVQFCKFIGAGDTFGEAIQDLSTSMPAHEEEPAP